MAEQGFLHDGAAPHPSPHRWILCQDKPKSWPHYLQNPGSWASTPINIPNGESLAKTTLTNTFKQIGAFNGFWNCSCFDIVLIEYPVKNTVIMNSEETVFPLLRALHQWNKCSAELLCIQRTFHNLFPLLPVSQSTNQPNNCPKGLNDSVLHWLSWDSLCCPAISILHKTWICKLYWNNRQAQAWNNSTYAQAWHMCQTANKPLHECGQWLARKQSCCLTSHTHPESICWFAYPAWMCSVLKGSWQQKAGMK